MTTPPITSQSTQGQKIDFTNNATDKTSQSRAMSVVILYIVIGALLFVVILLLLVIFVFTIYTVRNHRVKRKGKCIILPPCMYEIPFWLNSLDDSELDLKDFSHQSLIVHDRFTQTEYGIKSKEADITHVSGIL